MGKLTRHRIVVDESRIVYTNNNNQAVAISSEYTSEIPSYFNTKNNKQTKKKTRQVKDLNVSGIGREKLRRQFNVKASNKWLFLSIIYYATVIPMLQNHPVGYPDTAQGNIHVSQYYHDNVDEKIFKILQLYKKNMW